MERMLLILLLSGLACGQFLRFDDSFEDDSHESRFRPRSRTGLNRFDSDSDEHFFRGGNRRRFGDSDEKFFGGGRRNRFHDDSDEVFFGSNRNSFVRTNSNRNPAPFRSQNAFSRTPTFRPQNSFKRNNNNNNNNNFRRPIKIDSVEDLFEDLFDDDLDDRLRAQNTLSALGVKPEQFFRNSGSSTNRGFSSFNTRVGSNRFNSQSNRNTPRPTFQSQRTTNQNALNHFSIKQHTNRVPTTTPTVNRFNNGFSFGTTVGRQNNKFSSSQNQFSGGRRGVPLSNTFSSQRQSRSRANTRSPSRSTSAPNNRFGSNKRNSQSPLNSINSFGSSKGSSFFRSPSGFNWPGGNGYYVSMSTGNSKPFTYFVKYDD